MDWKRKRRAAAVMAVFWLTVVGCKRPGFLGGVGRAIEDMFRSIGSGFGF